MNDFDEFEDDFYRVRVESHEVVPAAWIARGVVIRKDTSEPIHGAQTRSSDIQQALKQLKESLRVTVAALPRPPYEWGATSVRLVLVAYKAFNEELTAGYMALEEKRSKGTLSKDELHEVHHSLRDMVRGQTIELIRKVEMLNETEKQQLVASPEGVYQHILDSLNLDDVYARDAMFDYILHPSAELTKLHETHHARMIAEFDRQSEPKVSQ